MIYSEWNEKISHYFFNRTKSGEEVYLFITKEDIINLGRVELKNFTDEQIWNDFLISLRKGASISTKQFIIEQAVKENNLWCANNRNENPYFLAYLVFLVLPVIEFNDQFNLNNYYGRLNSFLNENKFAGDNIERLNEIDNLWYNLEEWANDLNFGDRGIFIAKEFSGNIKYVGKIFSQCLLSPKIIRKLPELFLKANLIPNSDYSNSTFKDILLTINIGLNQNSIQTINDNNDLGNTITEIVKKEYKKWNGESNEIICEGERQIVKRNFFTTRLYSQFKVNSNDGILNFSYRIKTNNEFPDDLIFANERINYDSNDWSNTIQYEYKESLELRDEYNKWIAKFPKKNVRVFIGANNYQLSSDYWIEADKLNKFDWNYILCIDRERDKIIKWGSHFNEGDFIEEDLEGIPKGYSLFKILRPPCSLNGITELTIFTKKSFEIKGGLKIEGRKYLNILLPEIEIDNSNGNESVYIKYDDLLVTTTLNKKNGSNNVWLLPKDILPNRKFTLNITDENIQLLNHRYEILSNENSYSNLEKNDLIKRNKFGELAGSDESNIIQGVLSESYNLKQQEPYLHLIKPTKISPFIFNVKKNHFSYKNEIGNNLISYITFKKECSIEEFYNAFKFIFDQSINEKNDNNKNNIPTHKYLLLNYYDNLGFIDYDYEAKKISVVNPQFINLPTSFGRKILLIGGRDRSLIENIFKYCNELKLSIELIERDNYFKFLPDIITINSYDSKEKQFGESKFVELAHKLNIEYRNNIFVPFGLQNFSSTIWEYENYLIENKLTDSADYDWARKIFNYETLEFEKNDLNEINKEYSLIEYKLNEYTIIYKIWINEKCFIVDRNWGRYLIMNNKQWFNILFDKNKEKLAIPVNLPLPKILSKSIYLLSNKLPVYKQLSVNNKSIKYLIFENIPFLFAYNLFKFKLNQEIQEYNL